MNCAHFIYYLMTAVHITYMIDVLEQYTFPVCTLIKVFVTAVSDTGGNVSLTISCWQS